MQFQDLPLCGNGVDAGIALGDILVLDRRDEREGFKEAVAEAARVYGLAPNDKRHYLTLFPFIERDPEERKRAHKAAVAFVDRSPAQPIAWAWKQVLQARLP